jgi:FKBP-type peptidyl-prolyl cis-trans isomerase FkpA
MKNWFLLFLASVFIFGSCKKSASSSSSSSNCTAYPSTVASAAEYAYLQNYLSANTITTAVSVNHMFYLITNPGTGAAPNLCSTITVTYTGTTITGTTNGPQFDAATTPVALPLRQLIAGWQLVMPLVRAGGQVTLYIPPSLAYGSTPTNGLPANSYLKFVINLISVQ